MKPRFWEWMFLVAGILAVMGWAMALGLWFFPVARCW